MFGAYVRVSSEEQKKYGHGADAQVHAIKQYCHYNEIFINEENWYIDKGHTGSNENRPEFIRLNDDIKSGRIDGLIVTTTERISRKIVFREQYFSNLLNLGVEVRAINELFDWNTAYGRQQNRSKAVYDQAESELASERTKKALDQSARSGNYPKSKVPRGYKRIKTDDPRDKRIEVDEDTRQFYESLFNKIASYQYSVNQLCDELNETKALGLSWEEETLREMFKNPIYIGTYESKRLKIENHSPALISNSLWSDTQKAISKRKKGARHSYFFHNRVICTSCGKIMDQTSTFKQQSGKRYYYYRCRDCRYRVSENDIEEYLITILNSLIKQDEDLAVAKEILLSIERVELVIKKVDERFVMNLLNKQSYENTIDSLTTELSQKNKELQEVLVNKKLNWYGVSDRERQYIATYFNVYIFYNGVNKSLNIKSKFDNI